MHEQRPEELRRLVQELLPAIERLTGVKEDLPALMEYLEAYSRSIPNAVPSKELAMAELHDRNILFLKHATNHEQQSFHKQLLKETVIDPELLELPLPLEQNAQRTKKIVTTTPAANTTNPTKLSAEMKNIGLTAWGLPYPKPNATSFKDDGSDENDKDDTNNKQKPRSVVVVGSGIIGTSLALSLAQKQPNWKIAVVDSNPQNQKQQALGTTTPASWAWLNANGKYPFQYQQLNQLGLFVWKRNPLLKDLVSWMGSLVRFSTPPIPSFVERGGYPVHGPLSLEQVKALEPMANWQLPSCKTDKGDSTYFFPDEGSVDPTTAVQTLQVAAKDLGVVFLRNQKVTEILRDHQGYVCGVESWPSSNTSNTTTTATTTPADLVVVAAGVGAAAEPLGGLPLLDRPGQIAYATPERNSPAATNRLTRILVDPLRSSHVLQRADGSIVAGGGALETGGVSSERLDLDSANTKSLLDGAKELAPSLIETALFEKIESANRPMPSDGLPIVGYMEYPTIYAIVTHSGMTLGPLLGELASSEIELDFEMELLGPYRPSRFVSSEVTS